MSSDLPAFKNHMFSVGPAVYSSHCNLMPCVIIGLARDVRVILDDRELKAPIVRVRPDILHTLEVGVGGGEILYLDGVQSQPDLDEVSELPEHFRLLPDAIRAQDRQAIEFFRKELAPHAVEPDIEVVRFVQDMYSAPMERPTQLELSERLGLERTQALKHFKFNTGQTFRKFKKWTAILAAIRAVLEGQTIGSAGIDSGFSDAAHVARSAREIFGVTPTYGMTPLESFISV